VSKSNVPCGEARLTAFFNTLLEELLDKGPQNAAAYVRCNVPVKGHASLEKIFEGRL